MNDSYSFATAYTKDGEVYDRLANLDTAISYANMGYTVTIHKESSLYTKEQMQEAVNAELAAALDCFGPDHQQ